MRILREPPSMSPARQLRRTLVQGADEKHYMIDTFRLYDFPIAPEFATHETNVTEINAAGTRRSLAQPLIKRFYSETGALGFHQEVLDRFDEMLRLMPPQKKEH